MKDINKIILLGRIGAEPTERRTQSGMAVTRFSLATSYYSTVGEKKEDTPEGKILSTQWHQVVVWGGLAELCARHLDKGERVYLEGKMVIREYESKEGEQKTAFEVHATEVSFLGKSASSSVSAA